MIWSVCSVQPIIKLQICTVALHWRHNDHDGVSNHQPHGCLLNRLFRRRSKKTSKLRVTGLCVGNSPGPVNSPHKGPVTRKMFPFDDVIMGYKYRAGSVVTATWANISIVNDFFYLPYTVFYTKTSSNGNIFHVTCPLCGDSIGHRWFPFTEVSDEELWCFLWSVPEQTVK